MFISEKNDLYNDILYFFLFLIFCKYTYIYIYYVIEKKTRKEFQMICLKKSLRIESKKEEENLETIQ